MSQRNQRCRQLPGLLQQQTISTGLSINTAPNRPSARVLPMTHLAATVFLPTKMAPPAKNRSHRLATDHLCFLLILSIAALSSLVSATDSSLCTIPSPAPKHVPAGDDTLALIQSFQLSSGYFSGGEDIHFATDESYGGSLLHVHRSFTLLLLQVDGTDVPTVIHVSAALTLSGGRSLHAVAAHRRRNQGGGVQSVSFHLDGYYSSTSAELCMVGSGTYKEDDGWPKHLTDVVLRLRVPSPPSLLDPFVTGQLNGAGFDVINLVAYAEGDGYKYGEPASCPPSLRPSSTVRGAGFSCAHLKEQLVGSYKLQRGGGDAHASSTSPAPLIRLQEPRMHVGQVQCTADGSGVRVYATFSNNTNMWGAGHLRPGFMVKEAAVVAEGRWDSGTSGTVVRAMPHVYDEVRSQGYVPSATPSNVYAGTRDDRFGVAWDVVVPCGAALLAVLLFFQQRLGSRRRSGEYEMVSTQLEN